MICSSCQATKILPDCFDQLILGTVNHNSTDFYIYIKDLTTVRTERIEATSNGAGELKFTNSLSFSPSHSYELWITLKTAASPDDKQGLLINSSGTYLTCFSLRFETSFNSGTKGSIPTATLIAA